MSKHRSNSGHIALYAVLLPFVLALSTLVIDVANWNATRDLLQKEAATIAQQCAALLPHRQRATEYAQTRFGQLPALIPHVHDLHGAISFPSSETNTASAGLVKITLRAQYSATFSAILTRLGLAPVGTFSLERSTTAQVVPADYVLIISDSSSLRPSVIPWGEEILWPAAELFQCSLAPDFHSSFIAPNETWAAQWSPPFSRLLTQSCFNPILSSLKRTIISLVDRLGALPRNRLAVIFSPGNDTSASTQTIRRIHHIASDPTIPAGFTTTAPTATTNWTDVDYRSSALACLQFATPLCTGSNPYELWTNSFAVDSPANILNPTQQIVGAPFSLSADLIDPEASNQILLREAIYWNPAKPATRGTLDIVTSINQALFDLLAADDHSLLERGNLGAFTQRHIIIFSESLAGLTDYLTSETVNNLEQARVHLHILPYRHSQLSPAQTTALEQSAGILQTATASSTVVHLYPLADETDIFQNTLPKLIANFHQVAVNSYD